MKTTWQEITKLLMQRNRSWLTSILNALRGNGVKMISRMKLSTTSKEIKRSPNDEEEPYRQRTECRNCGFNEYDKIINIPTKFSKCESEWISGIILIAEINPRTIYVLNVRQKSLLLSISRDVLSVSMLQ